VFQLKVVEFEGRVIYCGLAEIETEIGVAIGRHLPLLFHSVPEAQLAVAELEASC
jgi:hypothetical protein